MVGGHRRQQAKAHENIKRTSAFGLLYVGAGAAALVGAGLYVLYATGLGYEIGYFGPAFVAATLTAGLVVEARARLGRSGKRDWIDIKKRRHYWNRPLTVALAAALYGGALVVAAVIFWPQAVQLPSAKVCTTTGFEERGDLIGTGSGGVYLAEPATDSRLIAAYPSERVDELFIGADAASARCDPHGQPPIVLVREASTRTVEAAKRAKRASMKVAAATKVRAARAALVQVAAETAAAGNGDVDTARAVNRWLPGDLRVEPGEGDRARDASDRAHGVADTSKGTLPERLRRMRGAARRAVRAAKAAASEARRYEASALSPAA